MGIDTHDIRAVVLATGSYLPETVVNNEDMTWFPKNAIQLIETKTGVRSRRYAAENESTSDLAIRAAEQCIERAGIDSKDIDGIILATSSPDRIQPATATKVQSELGATNSFAFDLNSVCSGSVYGISIADGLIRSGVCGTVLVVASELYSRFLNRNDFSTAPYFGDGSGAILLGRGESGGVIRSILRTDGSGSDAIQVPAGGTMMPGIAVENPSNFCFKMDGKKVYAFAIEKGTEVINEILSAENMSPDNIRLVVPHQANVNIIKEISRQTKIDIDRFHINLDRVGNTAGASVMIALDEAVSERKIEKGDIVILVAFGGGLSWGANLIEM